MEKSRLLDFIDRYHLGGDVEAAIWEKENSSLFTKLITGDHSMIGDVTMNNFIGFEDKVEVGILTTSQLIKMLSVLSDNIELKLNKIDAGDEIKYVSMNLTDNDNNVTYMLSDLSIIQRSKGLKDEAKFTLKFNLTNDFIDTYIKAKSALSETKIFTILKDKSDKYKVILGYSQINTNRIIMSIEEVKREKAGKNKDGEDIDDDRPISFNADYFRDILVSNKDAKLATLEISYEGLAHIHIEDGDYIANYYLVEAETDA